MKGPAELTHGPFLIGLFFNILLQGILIAQAYFYYTKYRKDLRWLRLLVLVLFLVELVNTAFNCFYIYQSLVINFGDVQFLAKTNWFLFPEPLTTAIIELMVQVFYAWRIRTIRRGWVMSVVITVLSVAGVVGCLIASLEGNTSHPEFSTFQEFVKTAIILWLVCAAAADVLIAVVLVWSLRQHKTGFKSTDMMIDRIIRITMQTNLFTALVAIADLISFLADPTGTHFIFNLNLSKLYSNSLMSSLNARSTPSSTRDNGMSTFEVAPSSGFAFQSQLDSAKPGWMRDEESSLQNQTSTKVTSTRSEWSLNPQGCHTLPPGSDVSAHAGYSHASDETGGIGATKADSGLEDKARSTTVELGINHDTDEHRFGN